MSDKRYLRRLDSNNRIRIPKEILATYQSKKAVLLSCFKENLVLFELSAWKKFLKLLDARTSRFLGPDVRFFRLIISASLELNIQQSGKVEIGKDILNKYEIEKEILIIDKINFIIILNPKYIDEYDTTHWENLFNEAEDNELK